MILIEKEFRGFLVSADWEIYWGRPVAIQSTEDAIIPQRVYMGITERLHGVASGIAYAAPEILDIRLW